MLAAQKKAKRVAVITPNVPHPTAGASTVLFFHYIRAIAAAGHSLLCMPIVPLGKRDEQAIGDFVAALNAPDRVTVAPIETAAIHEPGGWRVIDRSLHAAEQVSSHINSFQADAIVCFDLAAAALAKDAPARLKTVWLGDLAFAAQWHNFIYGMMEDPLRVRWLPYMVAQRIQWKRLYRDIISRFDPVIVSSGSSVAQLRQLGLSSRYEPYPWPENTAGRSNGASWPNAKPTFLFFGTLVALGSRSSFHFLFRHLYPRLVNIWGEGGFEILMAGRGDVPEWAMAEIFARPECKLLGFVDDLAALMAKCHAVIVPISAPVGNRSRILTALANGALVVAHRNVALGNPALVHGQTCLLADDAEMFATHMRQAFEHPERVSQIKEAGRQMYCQSFSPEAAAPLFARMIGV